MSSKIQLRHVEFIPKQLDEAKLYVSTHFKVAAHICPCGCGTKIITPLGPCEWAFAEKKGKPTLSPSVGNWQIPCRSHYWIKNGHIEWSYLWTDEQIKAGRSKEQASRELYFRKETLRKKSFWKQFKDWISKKL